jgi:hypothetical protein
MSLSLSDQMPVCLGALSHGVCLCFFVHGLVVPCSLQLLTRLNFLNLYPYLVDDFTIYVPMATACSVW